MSNIEPKAPPDQRTADGEKKVFDATGAEIKFGFINKNCTNNPLARSAASLLWKKRDDEWIAKANPDADGDVRLIYSFPEKYEPSVPNVGAWDLFARLGALGIMAQRDQVNPTAKKSGKRAGVSFHRDRIDGKKGLTEAVMGNKYGSGKHHTPGHKVGEAFEEHQDKYGRTTVPGAPGEMVSSQTSEKTVMRRAYLAKVAALLEDREALGDVVLYFRSVRAAQLAMGRTDLSKEGRANFIRSLKLWQHLTIEFPQWRGDTKKHYRKRLRPLIRKIVRSKEPGGPLLIQLRAKWMPLFDANSYAQRITFPLNVSFSSPAALNLTLLMENWFEKDDSELVLKRTLNQICNLLGIPKGQPWQRTLWLRRAIKSVHRHRPGKYSLRIKDGKFRACTASERERQKATRKSASSEREARWQLRQTMERNRQQAEENAAMERQGFGDA